MSTLRPHLALTVTDVERSIPFYVAGEGGRAAAIGDSCGCGDDAVADGTCCSQVTACCQTTETAAVAS